MQASDALCLQPPVQQVKEDVVGMAVTRWPLQFSGLFEAFKISGKNHIKPDAILSAIIQKKLLCQCHISEISLETIMFLLQCINLVIVIDNQE
jgi:hypothetical protein